MGLCSTAPMSQDEKERIRREKQRSRELDQQMHDDNGAEERIKKLLLLGAGESGKSTLFKQMSKLYGVGFPESVRKTYKPIIYSNVITAMHTLISKSATFGSGEIACQDSASKIMNIKVGHDEVIDEEIASHIAALWKDPCIQLTYENRAGFQLTDSAKFFFEIVEQIGASDYMPSEQDVLRSRIRTTGIVEEEYFIDGETFKIYDVGGQRAERKKWIHCFENVTAVLFVGVLSEYNLTLFEEENTNRMQETLTLFDETINSRWFSNTAIILFLNKRDLFAEKIEKYPLTTTCPLFEGYPEEINNYENGTQAIQEKFLERNNRAHGSEDFFTHITCATDTDNCEMVFNAVREIVILKVLRETGML